MSSSDLLMNNYINMLSIQKKTSETASKYFDTQTVSTENDVYHCLRTQLSILIMQIQEWLSGSFDIRDVYGCIGTDLLLLLKLSEIFMETDFNINYCKKNVHFALG